MPTSSTYKLPRMHLRLLSVLFCLMAMTSCSVDKYLRDGDKVLYRNKIEVVMADSAAATKEVDAAAKSAEKYLSQKPNKRALGVRWKMRLYCSTRSSDSSWWGNLWREQGERPVVYSEELAYQSARQLERLMGSKGCFQSEVTFDTIGKGHRDVTVCYTIHASSRYRIDEVKYRSMQQDIDDLLQAWQPNSRLHIGDYYDQDVLQEERRQIAAYLQQKGYYYASSSLIHFYIDTTYDSHQLSILVSVRQPEVTGDDGSVRRVPLQVYHIDNIYIYPNSHVAMDTHQWHFDTLVLPYNSRLGKNSYNFIYSTPISPSPRAISRSMYIFNGQTYRPSIVSNTTNGLLDLNNFKFIDISFKPSPQSSDTNRLLDAQIRLLNTTQHRISLSFELTNGSSSNTSNNNYFTSGNLGLGQNLSYHNNNLFGGAEQFTVEENLLLETPKSVLIERQKGFYNIFSSFELGGSTTLDLPEFILPFTSNIIWQRSKPHTLFNLSTDYIYRIIHFPSDEEGEDPLSVTLERIRFSTSWGYTWNQDRTRRHKLMPINVSFTHTISGDLYFDYLFLITKDIRYLYQTNNYVLLNTLYEYTYSNQQMGVRKNFDYLHLAVETAGNLMGVLNRALDGPLGEDKDVDYYQYFYFNTEYKHYFHIGTRQTLVLRTLVGAGLPYGHSHSLPYEKVFFGGGPTTMRAWQIRYLGPGEYPSREMDYPFSVADVQVVANIEHRFPLFSIFEGALFCDVGNIWNLADFGIGEDAAFDAAALLRGVAWGAGFGLRANVSIITLRLDLAFPVYDPGYAVGNRWISDHFAWNKMVANFGVNYPF